jgi:hypothetical protein
MISIGRITIQDRATFCNHTQLSLFHTKWPHNIAERLLLQTMLLTW